MADNPLRQLPSVSQVLDAPALADALAAHPRHAVVAAVRVELASLRERLGSGEGVDGQSAADAVAARAAARLTHDLRPRLRVVINATGIVLHTNLGRAPMAEAAAR